jgi:DDE family transposase
VRRITRQRLGQRKHGIQRRLRPIRWREQATPMFRASNIQYEIAGRARGLGCGGIGAMHLLARRSGLIEAIDSRLHLLKTHLPYHESDHVLNVAYNILCGGTHLEDIETRRNDEVYLDALGAQRIPDPTTEGDFCRRFAAEDVETLMEAINAVRVQVWRRQESTFFEEAILEADGVVAETTGECKQGMDYSYKGVWGYHPLVVSLANTGEPLYLVNRSGNRPSSEGAAARFDQAIALCRQAGFRSVLLRGDTDFTQTSHLDRWDGDGVRFVFGTKAMPNLVARADGLVETAWKPLDRPAKHEPRTAPRRRPANVKEQIVVERGFENIRLQSEEVASFAYSPTACQKTYRVVVLRKNLSKAKGEARLFDDIRYFFYITNVRPFRPTQIVFSSNARCNQENLIGELTHGVQALRMPTGDLVSNWAYMVMASLAWTLKAWLALWPPAKGRWKDKHRREQQTLLRMEFKQFLNGLMRVPCQIVRAGRRIVYRLLGWTPWLGVLLRAVDVLRQPLRC